MHVSLLVLRILTRASLLLALLASAATAQPSAEDGQWTMPAKNFQNTRYSALDQIKIDNAQAFEQFAIAGLIKEFADAGSDARAHFIHLQELFFAGVRECVHGPEVFGEKFRSALADLASSFGLGVRRSYSFPLPRWTGQLFTYNEFVLLAQKPWDATG